MKKKLAKLVSLALALSMCFGQSVFAGEVGMSGEGSATGTAPSEFSVADAESSAVVRLPANLDLDFSEELGAFQIVSNVGVYGDIKDFAEISVSIDEDLVYSDGQLPTNASSYSKTLPELTSDNEEYPYVYEMKRLGSSTNGSSAYATLVDVVFESKGPMFLTLDSNNYLTMYGYYNEEVSAINQITKDDNTLITSFVVSDAGNAANGAIPKGFMRVKSLTLKSYNSDNGTCAGITEMQKNQTCTYVCNGLTTSIGTDGAARKLVNNYEFKHLETSCLVFSTPATGKAYFSYNADDYNHVTGKVLFGENANGVCTETWNSEQAALGLTNHDVEGEDDTDYRTIMVNVPSYEVTTSGTYYATAEFEINFTCVGMNSDIGATTKLSGKEIEESDYSYAWDEDYTSTASMVNLGRMGNKPFVISTSALKDNTSMQSIEHVQLADNTTTSYLTYIDDTNPTLCNSWLMGMHGVQVLIIPGNVTTEQLHRTAGNTRTIDENTELTISNSVTAVFDETNTKIGNAMCFVKNIDANGKFIYVPHICYRGTKDEFKALSGHDNWVFGNKGNIITVHCTDGIMYY